MVDFVYVVDEEDEDEDECDFYLVLYFCYDFVFRDEVIFIWLVIGVFDCVFY